MEPESSLPCSQEQSLISTTNWNLHCAAVSLTLVAGDINDTKASTVTSRRQRQWLFKLDQFSPSQTLPPPPTPFQHKFLGESTFREHV
jgi:hypothetical protein